jgi:hypothetical protein
MMTFFGHFWKKHRKFVSVLLSKGFYAILEHNAAVPFFTQKKCNGLVRKPETDKYLSISRFFQKTFKNS